MTFEQKLLKLLSFGLFFGAIVEVVFIFPGYQASMHSLKQIQQGILSLDFALLAGALLLLALSALVGCMAFWKGIKRSNRPRIENNFQTLLWSLFICSLAEYVVGAALIVCYVPESFILSCLIFIAASLMLILSIASTIVFKRIGMQARF